jgi:basic membrane protein A
MLSRIIRRIIFCLTLLAPMAAFAAGESALWMPPSVPPAPDSPLRPIAIVYFNSKSDIDQQHAASIQNMVNRAKNEFGLSVNEYMLAKEDELASAVDKIADSPIGLIIIVAPRSRDALAKIPSLYPDIHFSVIDLDPPEYFPNGNSMVFDENEGLFMIGALAAWHSKSGIIEFISSEDTQLSREMANAFIQGAHYAKPDVDIIQSLDAKTATGDDASDIAFVADEDHLQTVLRNARQQKRLLITYDHNMTSEYPGLILTTLIKRYDLAIYTILKTYQQNQWKANSQTLGISDGYMDYTLSSNNTTLLSEDIIDKLERIKDLTARGVITITPLKQ